MLSHTQHSQETLSACKVPFPRTTQVRRRRGEKPPVEMVRKVSCRGLIDLIVKWLGERDEHVAAWMQQASGSAHTPPSH